MHVLQNSYRGLSLMVEINADRILFLATLAGGLLAGAYLGTF